MSLPDSAVASRDELLIAALRHANRVGGTLNALAAEISRLLGEAADEPKYGRLYDLLLRRFDSDSGLALFIAARNLRVELPPDLCGELPDSAVAEPTGCPTPGACSAAAEIERLRKALHLCAARAGIPDPQEACRAVLRTAQEALRLPDSAVGDDDADAVHLLPDRELWVIWSEEHGRWWAPGKQGYVDQLAEAGRYREAEVRRIEREANLPVALSVFREVAIPDPLPALQKYRLAQHPRRR